ncbi:PIN domain-containing protein [Microbacterium ulmi]|uniref:Ribonuclease VapC n=1 Tax=Microbacterium ulmi TaxID=179095 RepID=A0A7Y2M210_9MICO|nr:putative nucleic acid-binding protein [Microbacterium ulmi]NNH05055.1 PIN domain-containing protein [Microbacterium ulmi]
MIYLDTCFLIYAVEDPGALGEAARALLRGDDERFAISPLVMTEALVGPLRRSDETLLHGFGTLFAELELVDLSLSGCLRATELRAASPSLKTIDALHLAAAELGGCTALWTNDSRLATASGGYAVDVFGGQAS